MARNKNMCSQGGAPDQPPCKHTFLGLLYQYKRKHNSAISGIILTRHLGSAANLAIPGANLSTSAILLGLATRTADFTTTSSTPVQITGFSLTVTIPSGGRSVKLTMFTRALVNDTSGSYAQLGIWDGTVGSGIRIGGASNKMPSAANDLPGTCIAIVTPGAGTKTYNVSLNMATSGTAKASAVSTEPAYFIAELI